MNLRDLTIDNSWTLFLDRDGVINRRIIDGYVARWEDFEFLPGVLESWSVLASLFPRILIVSNQQGIGKGLMTENDLAVVHKKMVEEIINAGGRVDAIFHCPYLEKDHSILRKPSVGMALKARKQFPEIVFRKSLMAGDSISDMIFGKRLGMKTAFLCNDLKQIRKMPQIIDFVADDLAILTDELTRSNG